MGVRQAARNGQRTTSDGPVVACPNATAVAVTAGPKFAFFEGKIVPIEEVILACCFLRVGIQ